MLAVEILRPCLAWSLAGRNLYNLRLGMVVCYLGGEQPMGFHKRYAVTGRYVGAGTRLTSTCSALLTRCVNRGDNQETKSMFSTGEDEGQGSGFCYTNHKPLSR